MHRWKWLGVPALAYLLLSTALWAAEGSQGSAKEEVAVPDQAIAMLLSTKGSDARGVVLFREKGGGVHITGRVEGLAPGKHGFHIHEYGDLSAPDGTSAGSHFAPLGKEHGSPGAAEHHYGDLGNIEADASGVANIDIQADWMKLHFIVGRAMVVHEKADDFRPPTGHAGGRVAVGVIGVANPDTMAQARRSTGTAR